MRRFCARRYREPTLSSRVLVTLRERFFTRVTFSQVVPNVRPSGRIALFSEALFESRVFFSEGKRILECFSQIRYNFIRKILVDIVLAILIRFDRKSLTALYCKNGRGGSHLYSRIFRRVSLLYDIFSEYGQMSFHRSGNKFPKQTYRTPSFLSVENFFSVDSRIFCFALKRGTGALRPRYEVKAVSFYVWLYGRFLDSSACVDLFPFDVTANGDHHE